MNGYPIGLNVLTALTAASLADFAGMYVDTSDPVSLNATPHRSHRVYAVFTDSTDRVISVSGAAPIGGPDFEFAVIGSGSLYRKCLKVSFCEQIDVVDGGCALTAFGIVAEPYSSFCIRGGNGPLGSLGMMSPAWALQGNSSSVQMYSAPQFLQSPLRGMRGPRTVFLVAISHPIR